MREIKIRVWDGKEYRYFPALIEWDFEDHDIFQHLRKKAIELSTGLRDKNKKIIYDGDIMNWDGFIAAVYWNERDGCFARKGMSEHYFGITAHLGEIIGNVHEDPDLLTR